ncbi:MAG: hypothetical protein LH609_06600 [Rudanella sp.]|nr:hypothetical protein [Rudanella sp.]
MKRLNTKVSKVFQYSLAANNRFQQIGYEHVSEMQRYLYELAFNYYYLHEDQKVIDLLTEAGRFPPFNSNLHIQTCNTLGLVYSRLNPSSPTSLRLAEKQFGKAKQLAAAYGSELWVSIVNGNLGKVYAEQKQWQAALNAYRNDYEVVMKSGKEMGYPVSSACQMARTFLALGQLDSCLHYLRESQRLHRINRNPTDFSQNLQAEQYLRYYYDIARQYYQTVGNLPEAYRCADSLMVYQERIGQRYRSKAAALAEQRLLVQKHQTEVAGMEQQHSQQRLWLIAVGIVMLLVALLLGLLYRSSQHRRRQEARANAEREKRLALENQVVTDELERANADLTLFMDSLHQKESLIERITTDLERLTHPADGSDAGYLAQFSTDNQVPLMQTAGSSGPFVAARSFELTI